MELWVAIHEHEYGADSYLFKVPKGMLVGDEAEPIVALLNLDFDGRTETLMVAPVRNIEFSDPLDLPVYGC